ncbi:MAG: hypothetical protein IJZ53_12610 [Tyzzerella sp.]|nr:hypothetical protein [Tyzzerella sp.]
MCNYKKMKKLGILTALMLVLGITFIAGAASEKDTDTISYGTEDTSKYEVLTNRHTQYVEAQEAKSVLATTGFEEKLNNGTLSVWYNTDMEALRIVDLRSGYIWGCIDDKEEYNLNKKWTSRASSMLYITYFNLEGKEESCALSDNTFKAEYDWEKDGFTCDVSARKLGISFSFAVEIQDEKLTFSMKDESVKETGKSKLAKVSFMSFFGSVYEDTVPGYVMVPDGSGALIRFQKTKVYLSGYSRKVYGNDLSIDKNSTAGNLNGNRTDDYATEENQLSFPLWGMVHGEGQNGFLATIDSGELYTVINAIPAGAENQTVKFTRAYADFIYRCEYNKRVSNSKVVTQPQEEMNQVNPMLTYTFLTGEDADYSGMANIYREQLLKKELLPQNEIDKDGDISLLLHVAGSEVEEGFLSNGLATLTTVEQAEAMLDKLEESGIQNISMVLSGWNKGGYHGASYGTTKFEKKVGSRSEVEDLQKKLEEQGGSLSLVLNLIKANKDQINVNQDPALNATLDTMMETIPNKSLMYPDTYYVRQAKIAEAMKKTFEDLEGFDILLEDMAKYLYADYTINNEKTRDDVRTELIETVEKAKGNLLFDAENLYMLKYASELADVPVSSSQYVYETDSIPFLQMVLRGSVDYYAPYSNLGFYSDASILKMVEYGAYPSFMVMNADNFSLSDTPLENYFSLNFGDWEDEIYDVYGKVNEALQGVKGAAIIDHRVLEEGVYSTTYDNGVHVYVNYNNEDYVTEGGTIVPAGGYEVEG